MSKYILCIDQGTTGSTALLIDSESLELVGKSNREFKQHFPNPAWVEHDLNQIWSSVELCTKDVLEKYKIKVTDIISIGITNQRETTCAYKRDGTPLEKAIVWQDRRTADFCESQKDSYMEKGFKNLTGLPLDPYFSGTKMKWFLDNSQNAKEALENNDLLLSTIDSYILYKLTNGESFYTDATNASRTLLMSLSSSNWDNELLEFFNIPKKCLPQIQDSFFDFGKTKGLDFLPDGIPISCILGDQQAALFGQGCFKAGEMKCTYGTGAFALLNTGEEIVYSNNGLLTTVAYKMNGKSVYALEGSTYMAGAAIQWLRDNLELFEDASETQEMARSVKDLYQVEQLLVLPFFTGIASPHWKAHARGSILGLTRGTSKNELVHATLEGINMSINDLIGAFCADIGNNLTELKVDGGACANNYLLELQANYSNLEIIRPKVIETTAYGVGLGALFQIGLYKLDQLKETWKLDHKFFPDKERIYFESKYKLWKKSIKALY
jgi:glycerol kinase